MRTAVLLFATIAISMPALAQEPAGVPAPGPEDQFVDRIVAIVGDSAIFHSDLRERLLRMESQGYVPSADEGERREFERDALNTLVVESLVLQAADRDTLIVVTEDRIEADLQSAWDQEVRGFGSEDALRRAVEEAGMTLSQHRENRRTELRNGLLTQQYVQLQRQQTRVPPVEESEIRAFFEREQEFLGSRPATMTLRQVVLVPTPQDTAKAAAREEAERILELLSGGEDFADLARRFSADAGSGQRGGELGWVRRGTMVQEFENAAFNLNRGQTSGVVETMFGAHIIQVERIRGPERLVRHILIAPQITLTDIQATRARAEEIRAAVAAGTSIREFSAEGEATGLPEDLEITLDQLGQLPGGYSFALRTANAGDVVGPIEFDAQGQPAFAIVHVASMREAGEFEYEDVREWIRDRISEERFEERIIDRLMAETFVETRW